MAVSSGNLVVVDSEYSIVVKQVERLADDLLDFLTRFEEMALRIPTVALVSESIAASVTDSFVAMIPLREDISSAKQLLSSACKDFVRDINSADNFK